MRVLAVTNQFPLPLDSGEPLRVDGLLRALATDHEVHLLALARPTTTRELVDRMADRLGGPVETFRPSPSGGFARRWGRALATGVPTYVRAQHSEELATRLRALAGENDVVVLLDDYAGGYGAVVGDAAPVVSDKHNVLGHSIASEPAPAGVKRRANRALSTSLIRRFERSALANADALTVTSTEEAERLEALYGRRADAVVLSAVDLPPEPLGPAPGNTIGWLGDHRYAPNVEGLIRFVEEAWTPLGEQGCRLLVPGHEPPDRVRGLERYPGVELVGFVEDLDELLSRLSAAVVPLWRGAGVKLKTLTFMAAGIPTVATPVALEGVAAVDAENCLVAGDPSGLGAALARVLAEPALAADLARNGRALIGERYTWDAIGPEFVEVVKDSAGPRTPPIS